MKKPLALFLAAAMLASYPAAAMTAGAEEIGEETSSFSYTVGKNVKNRSAKIFGDFEYAENDGNAVIVGYLGSDEEVVIPGRIDGFEVTVIGSEAFCDNTNLKSVVIPDSVTIIEDSAFIDCTGLTNVKFSENLAVIETNAFFGCSGLTKIELSENVAEIGKSAFYNCNSLKTAVIPNPDIEIGKLAFSKRSTELIIFCPTESNAVDFAKNGLGFCTYNVDEDDNIEISEFSSSVSEFEIPEKIDGKNVTVIGDGAFNKSIRLSSVKFPESLKTIGDEAFQNCLALERIDIPKNVENIGSQAFFGCSSLNDIYVYSKKAVVSDEAFLVGNKDLVIHAYSGTDSNSYADDNDIYFVPLDFHYSKNYGTVTEYCGDDKNVTVPKKIMGVEVTKVEVTAFDNAYLDDDVKNSVETINIPSTVKTLSGDVFDELPALSAVKVDSDNKKFKDIDGILYNKKGTAIIRCPEGYGSFISNGSGGEFILPESVTSVEKGAFENVSGLSKVVINPVFDGEGKEEKISIGDDVFDGCENLRNVTVYSKAVDFGVNSPITVDESPDVVMYGYLGSTAWDYAYDTSFKEKEVPFVPLDFRYDVVKNPETGDDEVKITGYDGDIDDLTLPAKIGGIPVTAVGTDGENPFFVGENSDDESPLVNLTVPKEILDLDPDIFDDLPNLQSISVDPENPNYADEDGVLFDKDKTELLRYPEAKDDEKYTVPETVEKIAPGAFEDCDNLSEVEIPENVGEIGDNAFSDCDNLEKAVIYDPEAVFDGTPFANDEDTLTIYGYLDSTADDYADENNIPFVPLDVRFIVNPENEDEVIITGYDGDNDVLNIPDNIGGKPVVGLDTDDKPFAGEGNTITDVTIPEGKEDEEYTVPDEVKKIGDGAFKDCDDLEKVVILDNVEDIADDAFDNHNPDLEIHGYEGTEAEVYADEHEIKFVPINDKDNTDSDSDNDTDGNNTGKDSDTDTDGNNTGKDSDNDTDGNNTGKDSDNDTDGSNTDNDTDVDTDTDGSNTGNDSDNDTDGSNTGNDSDTDIDGSNTGNDSDTDTDGNNTGNDSDTDTDGSNTGNDSDTDTDGNNTGNDSYTDTDGSNTGNDSDTDTDGSNTGNDSDNDTDGSNTGNDSDNDTDGNDSDTDTDGNNTGNDSDNDTDGSNTGNDSDTDTDGSNTGNDSDTDTDGSNTGNDSDTDTDGSNTGNDSDTDTDGSNTGNDSDTDTDGSNTGNDSDTDTDGSNTGNDSDTDTDGSNTGNDSDTDTDGSNTGNDSDTDTDGSNTGNDSDTDTDGSNTGNDSDTDTDGNNKQKYLIGDINFDGKIDTMDAVLILREISKLESFDDIQNVVADVNGDGRIDTLDAVEILRYLGRLEIDSNVGEYTEI